MSPAAVLAAQGHDVHIVMPSERSGSAGLRALQDQNGNLLQVETPPDADVMVLQRIVLGPLGQAIPMIRAKGIAVVVDMDDDLTCIDPRNLAWTAMHPRMGRPDHSWQTATRACLDATLVTVSTPALLRTYAPHGRGVVIDNYIPAHYLDIEHHDSAVIGWAGSVHSHPGDLPVLGASIARLLRDGHQFLSVGDVDGIRDALGLDADPPTTGYVSLDEWPAAMARIGIGVAPLADTKFNRSKCVDSSMRITTSRGVVPAGELEPGMSVWRDRWRTIEAVERGKSREGVLITTESGYQLRLTPEHRMYVNDAWMPAGQIAVGDLMAMEPESVGPESNLAVPWPADSRMTRRDGADLNAYLTAPDGPRLEITPRWGRFLGAFVGDGSCGQATKVVISCDGQDADWIAMLMDDVHAFGLHSYTQAKTTYGGTVLRRRGIEVASAHLLRVLESMDLTRPRPNGRPIRVPCVPEVIWRSPKPVIAEFLAGYFEADGTCTSSGVSVTSKGENLIRDVQRLLLLFGVESRIKPVMKHAQNGFTGTYWILTMRRAAADVFAKEIGFRSARKSARLAEIVGRPHSNAYRPMVWSQHVVSIEMCTVDPVDIQVEGSEFIAAGFVSHNSRLKNLEYAACGVPWVGSPRAEYRKLHALGCGVLAEKPRDWYRQLKRLAADPVLRADLSTVGRLVAAENTIEGNAWKWASAWEEALRLQRQAARPVPSRA